MILFRQALCTAALVTSPGAGDLPDLRCYADHRSHVSAKVDAVPVDSGLELRIKRPRPPTSLTPGCSGVTSCGLRAVRL